MIFEVYGCCFCFKQISGWVFVVIFLFFLFRFGPLISMHLSYLLYTQCPSVGAHSNFKIDKICIHLENYCNKPIKVLQKYVWCSHPGMNADFQT